MKEKSKHDKARRKGMSETESMPAPVLLKFAPELQAESF